LQQESGERLGALLVTLGVVAQRDVAEALAAQLDLPWSTLPGYPSFPILEERVSARFLRETRSLPLREDEDFVALAMADPTDAYHDRRFRNGHRPDGAADGRDAGRTRSRAWSGCTAAASPRKVS
jgi:hypothetical protein